MFHQRRQHTASFARTFETSKKSCGVFLSPRQVLSYHRNGKRLRPAKRRGKSIRTFTKKRSNDMKRHYRDIKTIIWMKWKLLTFTKSITRRLGRFHSLKKHHPNQMNQKKYQGHPNQMNLKKYYGLLVIQARRDKSLKKSKKLFAIHKLE